LYVRGIAPEATYQFKHAPIRDAAYEALLKSRRKELHRQVGQTIAEAFSALKEEHPEVLARHWTEAGETEKALEQWSRAGDAARAHNAFSEALESYRQALTLLGTMPESRARDLRELELTQSVVWMLQMTRAYSAHETIAATQRAMALAEKTGSLKQLLNWIFSRYITLLVSGELRASAELADQALELAIREGSAASLGMAYGQKMFTCGWAGDPAGFEKYFTEWLRFFEDLEFRQFPGALVAPLAGAAINAWVMGRAELARARRA
jgi:predicted ATPase